MKDNIKILQIIDSFNNNSGVQTFVLNQEKILSTKGFDFDYLVLKNKDISLGNSTVVNGNIYEINCNLVNLPFLYKKLYDFLKNSKYNIVHGHSPYLSPFYLHASSSAGIPNCVVHSHSTVAALGILKKIRNLSIQQYIRKKTKLKLACSNKAGKFLFGDNADFTVIPNGIDFDAFKYLEKSRNYIREKFNLCNKFIVGHVSRLAKEKNQSFLLDIFFNIYKINPNSVLLIAGDGSLKDELLNKAEKLGILENIIFLGICNNINELMSSFDVFILPSFFEGFPIVALEAQASGLPCYISDTVDKDIAILPTTKLLPLSVGAKEWARQIQKDCGHIKRAINPIELLNSPYSIENSGNILCNYYNTILNLKSR